MAWSQEKTLQFIECYRTYPFLWDSNHEFYKNKIRRHDALQVIAAKFEVDKVEVERKIKNLQSHFLREKKKEQDNKKSGSAAGDSFPSKWFAYKSLLFLSSRNKPRKSMDSEMIEHTAEESLDSTAGSTQSSDERPKRQRNVNNIKEQISNAYSIMTEVYQNRNNIDEFSLFGDQVAIKLRKISCPYAKVTVQNKINTLLMEGELGLYDLTETRKRNSRNITASSTYIPTPIRSDNSGSFHSDCGNMNFAISEDDAQDSGHRIFHPPSSTYIPTPIRSDNSGSFHSDCGNMNFAISEDDAQDSGHRIFHPPSSTYIPTPISRPDEATDSNCGNSLVPLTDQREYLSMNNQPAMNDEDNSQATQLSLPEAMGQYSRKINDM